MCPEFSDFLWNNKYCEKLLLYYFVLFFFFFCNIWLYLGFSTTLPNMATSATSRPSFLPIKHGEAVIASLREESDMVGMNYYRCSQLFLIIRCGFCSCIWQFGDTQSRKWECTSHWHHSSVQRETRTTKWVEFIYITRIKTRGGIGVWHRVSKQFLYYRQAASPVNRSHMQGKNSLSKTKIWTRDRQSLLYWRQQFTKLPSSWRF